MGAGVEQEGSGKEDIYFSEAIWFSTTGQIGNCKHFKFSLDMRSLQDSSLEIGPSYYLRQVKLHVVVLPQRCCITPRHTICLLNSNNNSCKNYMNFLSHPKAQIFFDKAIKLLKFKIWKKDSNMAENNLSLSLSATRIYL